MKTFKEFADEMAAMLRVTCVRESVRGDADIEQIAKAMSIVNAYEEAWPPHTFKKYSSLKEYLREKIVFEDDEDGPYIDLYHGYNFHPKNWPDVDGEPLDMENNEFISLTDTTLRMCFGGDWQEMMVVDIELVNGELTVTNVENCTGDEVFLDEEEFIGLLRQA